MTKSLVGAPENVYAAVPTESYNTLYIPNATHNTLSPLIFEIQRSTDESSRCALFIIALWSMQNTKSIL